MNCFEHTFEDVLRGIETNREQAAVWLARMVPVEFPAHVAGHLRGDVDWLIARVREQQKQIETLTADLDDAHAGRLCRHCDWPGCQRFYMAFPGPVEAGWMRHLRKSMLLCPDHHSLGHHPTFEVDGDDVLSGVCSCGDREIVAEHNLAGVKQWWAQHVTAVEAAAVFDEVPV